MKTFAACIALILICGGCYSSPHKDKTTGTGVDYTVISIDGCQYLQFHTYYYEAITHKGDCTNLIHAHMKAEKP